MTHILVIDNDAFGRTLLADTLSSSETKMTVATSAQGATSLERYREHHPDLVIVEIRLQEQDGLDTILSLHELDRELPILLTSRSLPVTIPEAGATHPRAVHRCDLLSAVRACLPRPVAASAEPGGSIDPAPGNRSPAS